MAQGQGGRGAQAHPWASHTNSLILSRQRPAPGRGCGRTRPCSPRQCRPEPGGSGLAATCSPGPTQPPHAHLFFTVPGDQAEPPQITVGRLQPGRHGGQRQRRMRLPTPRVGRAAGAAAHQAWQIHWNPRSGPDRYAVLTRVRYTLIDVDFGCAGLGVASADTGHPNEPSVLDALARMLTGVGTWWGGRGWMRHG